MVPEGDVGTHGASRPPGTVGELRVSRWTPKTRRRAPGDAVIICLPTALAGKGTARQLEQAAATFVRAMGRRGIPFAYVGKPVDCAVAELRTPLAVIEPSQQGVRGIYRAATAAFESALGTLYERGSRRPVIVSMGYTAYGPEAIRRAIEALAESGSDMEAIVCLVDSTYPDTDILATDVDASGWPESRFFGPAYRSTASLRTLFFVTSAYGYDPALLNRRAPPGLDGVAVIAPPYSDRYVDHIERIASEGKDAGLGPVAELLPGFERQDIDSSTRGAPRFDHRGSEDFLIPIVGSDIWSADAVDSWMTSEQHHSCLAGTKAVVQALVGVAEQTGRTVRVPIDLAGADYIRDQRLPSVAVLPPAKASNGEIDGARVVLSAYRDLSQEQHARLLGAADVAVSRTGGQANSTVVLALARTPNVVVDMPACGYMQSELTSLAVRHEISADDSGQVVCEAKSRPLGWLAHWTWAPEQIQRQVVEALTSEAERDRRAGNAYQAYRDLNASTGGNLFRIVAHLTGAQV